MERKYHLEDDSIIFMEEKKLRLGKKLSDRVGKILADGTAKLDL